MKEKFNSKRNSFKQMSMFKTPKINNEKLEGYNVSPLDSAHYREKLFTNVNKDNKENINYATFFNNVSNNKMILPSS